MEVADSAAQQRAEEIRQREAAEMNECMKRNDEALKRLQQVKHLPAATLCLLVNTNRSCQGTASLVVPGAALLLLLKTGEWGRHRASPSSNGCLAAYSAANDGACPAHESVPAWQQMYAAVMLQWGRA